MDEINGLRPAADEEKIYAFSQSPQIEGQTGFYGYLRGNFGSNGKQFKGLWYDGHTDRKDKEFKDDMTACVNLLNRDPDGHGLLKDYNNMATCCQQNSEAKISDDIQKDAYCFRLDSKDYSYLIRCSVKDSDAFTIYVYNKAFLNDHIARARNGIRFITPTYQELFRIPDGGRIAVRDSNGNIDIRRCRYIDGTHVEVDRNIYHIAEFAEIMQRCNKTAEPYNAESKDIDKALDNTERDI